jgi:SNF2 family DNA or RNA helicase
MTELTPVQRMALSLAKDKPGFAYFMDMGLGKTLTALTEFMGHAMGDKAVTRLVVICPNNFKGGWLVEMAKHAFKLDAHVLESGKPKELEAFLDKRYDRPPCLIIHYEGIRLDRIIDAVHDFTHKRGAMLVVDESIAIKDPKRQQTKAIHGIAPLFKMIRILTGKPTTQGAQDLWSQLRLIGGQPRRNFYGFRNTFCRMGGYMNKEVIGVQNEELLQKEMAPFVFHALKEDWLEGMPEKIYTRRNYELGDVLRKHYKEMEKLFVTWLQAEEAKGKRVAVEIALTKYMKLQQIMCGFIHDESKNAQALVDDSRNPRLQLLLECMGETSGKVAIVYKHRWVGEQLLRTLRHEGYGTVAITGGLTQGAVECAKAAFNDDPEVRVILLQVQASKFGHTLLGDQTNVGDACSTMIFYENSWSLDDRSQIEDRIHRIGQKASSCLYIDFVGSGMDEEIISALQHKEDIYQAVMGIKRRQEAAE